MVSTSLPGPDGGAYTLAWLATVSELKKWGMGVEEARHQRPAAEIDRHGRGSLPG